MRSGCIAVLILMMGCPGLSLAADEQSLDRKLEQARAQLDHAAQLLADLYQAKVASSKGSDKAMLGVLLADKPMKDGIGLAGVTPGGGADVAGIKAGDKIVGIAGQTLASGQPMRVLVRVMREVKPGDAVQLQIERQGQVLPITVTTQDRLSHLVAMVEPKLSALDVKMGGLQDRAGASALGQLLQIEGDLASYFGVDAGVLVVHAQAPLKGGDVLRKIAGETVETTAQAYRLLLQARHDGDVDAEVIRRGKTQVLSLSN